MRRLKRCPLESEGCNEKLVMKGIMEAITHCNSYKTSKSSRTNNYAKSSRFTLFSDGEYVCEVRDHAIDKYIKLFTITIFISITPACIQPVYAAGPTGTVSVVSFDGLGYLDAQRYMTNGAMPNLQKFQQESAYATDFVTVMPSLTAPSHAAMATGAGPDKTGIVSNQFHTKDKKVNSGQSGFSQPLGVTPIWKEARDQGKVTATVAFPDSNPENSSAATYAVYSGGTLAKSRMHKLKFSAVDDERTKQLSAKSLDVEEAVISLDIKDAPSQKLYVLRTVEKEPRIYISLDQTNIGEKMPADGWVPIVLDLPSLDAAGFYVKLKGDIKEKEELQLFQGTIMGSLYEGPENFAEQIESKFGFYPAADELDAFMAGQITRKEYEQIGEHFTKWVTDVSLYIKSTYQPDLLFYYYPAVDTELHEFLLRDPNQPGYNRATVQKNEKYVRWAFSQLDCAIGRIRNEMDSDDHLLLISDHGFEPIHIRLSPNKELEKSGLLVRDKKGHIDLSKTKAYAEVSGTIAHVYVNLKGRETKGIVEEDEFKHVKQRILSIFNNRTVLSPNIQDPQNVVSPTIQWLTSKTDKPVKTYRYVNELGVTNHNQNEIAPYEEVWTEDHKDYASLSNGNTGDVFLSAAPGFLMSKEADVAVEPTVELGSHGGDPERPKLRPILFAAGPKISPGKLEERISMIDIAPSLYELLELQPPDFVEGKPIWDRK